MSLMQTKLLSKHRNMEILIIRKLFLQRYLQSLIVVRRFILITDILSLLAYTYN